MFQFPSNGKVDSKDHIIDVGLEQVTVFQFPSNGKVDSKTIIDFDIFEPTGSSFNSLQTGKWIQRRKNQWLLMLMKKCFNSLQTGKWIQSFVFSKSKPREYLFQFPSNGKVDSK